MQKTTPWPSKLLKGALLGIFFPLFFVSVASSSCRPAENYYHFLVAEYLISKEKVAEAQKHLEKVVKCDKRAIFPKKELMRVYANKGDYEKALALAKEILKLAPDDKETLFIMAKLYWAQKRPARAIQTLEHLLEKYPDYEEAWSVLATIYLQKNNLEEAIAALEKLAQKNPKNEALLLELARLWRRKGDFEKARLYYEKALKLAPDQPHIYLEYGAFLEKIGAFAEAEKVYLQALKKTDQPFHFYETLLRLYLRQNQYEKALEIINELEKQFGSPPRLRLQKALILLDLDRLEEAIKILKRITEEDPQNYTAWFYLGVAYEKKGELEKATHAFERIPPKDELYPLALRRLAEILKDPQVLVQLFERAFAERPNDKGLYVLAGSIFDQLDACAEGLRFVKKGLEKFPDELDLAVSAGLLLICEGKEKEALKLVEPLIQKFPKDPTLLNFVGYTYADLNLDLDKAEAYIRKALAKKPNDGYIIDSLAWVYYRRGKYQEALKQIERALKLVPDDPIINEHYGDILRALGREKEALSAYRKALSLAKKRRERQRIQKKIEELCAKLSCSS